MTITFIFLPRHIQMPKARLAFCQESVTRRLTFRGLLSLGFVHNVKSRAK